MRIWDLHPGYLNRQSLLGEHRELHAIVSILRDHKQGYSRHPETLRWVGHGWALRQRHRLLVAEMCLRGFCHHSPVRLRANPGEWPRVWIDRPLRQIAILREKYRNKPHGRIALPSQIQQLWAQHKYSVMARDMSEYRRIGRQVAASRRGLGSESLAEALIELLRIPPEPGNLRNAVDHMWGYVAKYARPLVSKQSDWSVGALLSQIQRLAIERRVEYLVASTALSELQAWETCGG